MKQRGGLGRLVARYRRYVLHHALLARWAGADLFCVGVELSKTSGREAEWRDLIAAVRLFFPGRRDLRRQLVRRPGDREFLGPSGFHRRRHLFPAGRRAWAPGRPEIAKGARQVAERLARASRRFGKPVLLTEVGFAAQREALDGAPRRGGRVLGSGPGRGL